MLYVQLSPDGHDILAKTTIELARYYMGQVWFIASVLKLFVNFVYLQEQMVEAAAFQK